MIKDPVHNGGRGVLGWNHPASRGWERWTDLFLFHPQWLLDNPGTPCDAMTSVYEARHLVRVSFSGNMHLGLPALLGTCCPLPCPLRSPHLWEWQHVLVRCTHSSQP